MSEGRQTTLGDIGKWGSGGTPKSTEPSYYGGDIPWIRSGDLPDGPILEHPASITQAGLDNSSTKWVPEGAVLIALYGATIGKLGVTTYPVTTNQAVAYCLPHQGVTSVEYLFWYLLNARPELVALAQGGAQPNISQTILKSRSLILPSPREQCRIVAKLQNVFQHSKNARDELDRIPRLIERCREALFSAASRGDLTLSWRKNNANCEVASKLLQRIHARDSKRPELGTLLLEGDKLPKTWTSCRIGDVGDITLGRQRSPQHHSGKHMRPYLRVANVFENRIDIDDVMEMNFTPAEYQKFKLEPGDILLNEGQSKELVGRAAMFMGELEGVCFTNTLIRFRAHAPVSAAYALIVFRHYLRSGTFQNIANITTNIAHLGAGRFADLPFPLPPVAEQVEIVRLCSAKVDALDNIAARVSRATALVDRLDQATLGKAFRGELVSPSEMTGISA